MRCVGVLYPRIAPGPSVTKMSWDTDMRCAGLYIIFLGRVTMTSGDTLTLGELKNASPRTVRVSMAIWDILQQLKCARIFYLGWDAFRVRIDLGGPSFLKKMMVTTLYHEEKVLCFCHKEIMWTKAALLGYQVSSQL